MPLFESELSNFTQILQIAAGRTTYFKDKDNQIMCNHNRFRNVFLSSGCTTSTVYVVHVKCSLKFKMISCDFSHHLCCILNLGVTIASFYNLVLRTFLTSLAASFIMGINTFMAELDRNNNFIHSWVTFFPMLWKMHEFCKENRRPRCLKGNIKCTSKLWIPSAAFCISINAFLGCQLL